MDNNLTWIVIAVIAAVAVGKVIYQVLQGRSNTGTVNSGRNADIRPVQERPLMISANETGPMIYYANDRHGRRDKEYRFNYKYVGNSWRAYILRMPSLGRRERSGVVTHRHFDGNKPYVCWDTPIQSLKDMQTISRVWADNIQEYIATGKTFG